LTRIATRPTASGATANGPRSAQAHLVGTAGVAAAVVFTAFSEGGYGAQFISIAGLALWWAVLIGVGTRFAPAQAIPTPALIAGLMFTGFTIWALASIGWATDDGRALLEAARSVTYLAVFVAVVLCSRRGDGGFWLAGLTAGLATVALIALSARFFPSLDSERAVLARFLPTAQSRLGFPIGYWNALGACMAVAAVLLASSSASAPSRLIRSLANALLALPVLAIYLASSRGGAVAAALGLVVLFAFSQKRTAVLVAALLAIPAVVLTVSVASGQQALLQGFGTSAANTEGHELLLVTSIAVVATFLVSFLLDPLIQRLAIPRSVGGIAVAIVSGAVLVAVVAANPADQWRSFKALPSFDGAPSTFVSRHLQSGNGNGRYQFWETAADAAKQEPIIGLGAGGYEAYWNQNGPIEYTLKDAHSLVFETISELGIIGLALIGGFFLIAALVGLQRLFEPQVDDPLRREVAPLLAILGAGLAAVLIDWTWEIPSVAMLLLISAALLTGPATSPAQIDSELANSSRSWTWVRWRVPTMAIATCAILVSGIVLLTQLQLEASSKAVDEGKLGEARVDAQRASAIQPWAAEPYLQLALVSELDGDLANARQAIRDAIDRAPEDWRLRLVSTRLALRAGDVRDAAAALASARRLNPRSAILLRQPAPGSASPPPAPAPTPGN